MGRCPLLIPLAVLIALILIGDSSGLRKPQEPPSFGQGRYAAYVLSVREASTAGQLAVVEIDAVGGHAVNPFKARAHFVSDFPDVRAGNRVNFAGKLRPLAAAPDIPDVVDMQAALRREGVTASVTVARDSVLSVTATGTMREWFASLNEDVYSRLRRCPISPEAVSVLSAMLLGRTDMITDDMRMTFSAAGLSHLLALSGMHVGIIAMIVAVALWPFYLGRHTRTRLLLTIAALWFYAAFTGFLPSVTRAVIMATVYMGGRILQRRSSALNSLCLAAFVILLFNPEDLYSAGFQLSFSAVLGIILFYPLLNRVDHRNHPLLYTIASYPALSLSAMALTGIVAAFHFHTYPLYFLVANLLVVPLVPLLVFSGVVTLLLNADAATDFLVRMIDSVADFTASLPGSVVTGLYPPVWLVLLLSALLCLLAVAVTMRSRFLMLESVILLVAVAVGCLAYPRREYPAEAEYVVEEYRSTQRIVVSGDSCIILTDAKTGAEREEIEERYRVLLRDFAARRHLQPPTVRRLDN